MTRAAKLVSLLVLLPALLIGSGCSRQKDTPPAGTQPTSGSVGSGSRTETGTATETTPQAAAGEASAGRVSGGADWLWPEIAVGGEPLNLILLTLDTTRRDHLSCYGYRDGISPNLDGLAAEGVLFENAHSPVPVTLPAHVTMMTGQYPFQNGVRSNSGFIVPEEAVTLAELLKGKGYDTGAVLGAFPVERRFGLAQGFDFYEDNFAAEVNDLQARLAQRPAATVTELSLEWLDGRGEAPFFLWSHFYDPHDPYEPPEPFRSRFRGSPYDGEIAAMDAAVGRLLDGLGARGLLERSIVVAVGDHGESLGEHGERTHTIFVYGATQRVPLIVRFPRREPFGDDAWRGRRVDGLASLVDLLPTVWNALGFADHELPAVAGRSLLPLVQGDGAGHEWIYHESLIPRLDFGASDLRALQTERWKFIRAPRPELYDLQRDPDELTNLAEAEPDRLTRMQERLQEVLRDEPGAVVQSPLDPETVARLRSLGYVAGGGVDVSGEGPRLDPKDLQGLPDAVAKAQFLADTHRLEEAVALIDSLLLARPEFVSLQRQRGSYLIQLGRGAEAIAALDAAIEACRDCSDQQKLYQDRARASFSASRLDEALQQIRALLADDDRTEGSHLLLGEILQEQGDTAGAVTAFQREIELYPKNPEPYIKLGYLEQSAGRTQAAEKAYRGALEVRSQYPDALVMLSELREKQGKPQQAETFADQALASDPRHPGANLRKAILLVQQEDLKGALPYFEAALRAAPGNPTILFNLGNTYTKLGLTEPARRTLKAAIDTGRAPLEAYANLGVVYAQMERYQEAVDLWEEALAKDPDSPSAETIRQYIRMARDRMK